MGTLSRKERLQEVMAAGRRQRAAAFVANLKQNGEAMQDIFANTSCEVCHSRLARYEASRGFICVNGHRADLAAARLRLDAKRSRDAKMADREVALMRAWRLQDRRGRGQLWIPRSSTTA